PPPVRSPPGGLSVPIVMRRVSLRRVKGWSPEDERSPIDATRPGGGTYDRLVAQIVLIEDEPGIVDFVERGLRAGGLEVASALDGDEGLGLALGEGVELVVLDLMLPKRSGLEILEVLRRRRPGLPV